MCVSKAGLTLIVLLGLVVAVPQTVVAQSRFGIDIFGVSYHYQSRTYLDASGELRHYEQANPGLGAEYVVHSNGRFVVSAEAGAYRDSKDRTNVFAGPALRFRLGPHLLLGGALVVMTSRTYGTPIAPLPVVTAHWKHVGLNGTWIPSLARRESGAFALFSTIYF